MKRNQVLHVIDTLGIGGAEKLLTGIIRMLPQFEHHVAYLGGSEALLPELPPGCRVIRLPFQSKTSIFHCAFCLSRYIRQHSIGIVHSHLFMSTIIARMACPRDVKIYTTIHNMPSQNYFATRLRRWAEKLTYRGRHHLLAVSEAVLKDYDACIGIRGPADVLYNYVERNFFSQDYKHMCFNGTLKAVAVGSLKKAKNYSFLLDCFRKLPANIRLDIYGEGPLKEPLQAMITRHRLNVRLCGIRRDMWDVLPAYDLFVMSSVYEGQPVALLEAMASGMPAMLSDIPELREASGEHAIFFGLHNTHDFINKIKAIADHRIDLDAYAKAGFVRAKTMATQEQYLEALSGLYGES